MATYVRSIRVGDTTYHISNSGKDLYYSSSSKTGGSSLRGVKLYNNELRSTATNKPMSDIEIAQAITAAKSKVSSGCFITTVIVNRMGYPDDCTVLNELREFRDSVMASSKNDHWLGLLRQYDVVGPVLVEDIKNWPFSRVQQIFSKICRTVELVKLTRYEEAVGMYEEMVKSLLVARENQN